MTMLSLRTVLSIVMLAILAALAASCATKPAPAPVLQTTETVLCMFDYAEKTFPRHGEMVIIGGERPDTLAISPDGKHTAYTCENPHWEFPAIRFAPRQAEQVPSPPEGSNKWCLAVVDGVGGKKYDEIVTFQYPPSYRYSAPITRTYFFSPDSQRLAYVALAHGSYFIVADGVEGAPYQEIYSMAFSPDSKHVAFAAKKGGRFVVVRDGVEGGMYDAPPPGHLDDFVRQSRGYFDEAFPEWKATFNTPELVFSPDSRHLAYAVRDLNKATVVVLDGMERGGYSQVARLTFSPDSSRLAYFADDGKGWLLAMTGVDGKEYEIPRYRLTSSFGVHQAIVFSPNGKHFAYVARAGSKECVLLDNVAGEGHPQIRPGSFIFSPDSAHYAYLAYVPGTKGKMCVVYDGWARDTGARYDELAFSPDSRHFAFTKCDGKRWVVVLDRKKSAVYDGVSQLTFSPDSQHLAYGASNGRNRFVVLDGRKGRGYDAVSHIVFSPDSEHLAYLAGFYRSSEVLVLDDAEARLYQMRYGDDIVFPAPDKCRVYMRNGSGGISVLEAAAPSAVPPTDK